MRFSISPRAQYNCSYKAFIGHASLLPGHLDANGRGTCALGTVSTRTAGDPTNGPARFAVRSEQLQIHTDGPGAAGEVLDVSFFGHDATIRVRLDSGEHVAARTPADTVPRAGDRIHVEVVGDVVAFPSGAASWTT